MYAIRSYYGLGVSWAICFFYLSTQWLSSEVIEPTISHSVQITVKDTNIKKGKQQILAQIDRINEHQYWPKPKVRLSA